MFKSELAKLAGVSSRTFRRYLATRRAILTAMGVIPSPVNYPLKPSTTSPRTTASTFLHPRWLNGFSAASMSPFPRDGDSRDVNTHREPEGQRLESDTKTFAKGGICP